ncbi:MAG: 16S rRNA (adenine(1518)-N(6)/adenine(1519)-N(6))-dimethyltransferase RsmA [Parvularcula sp.]
MVPADLPPLREVIASHDLAANKGLGQHFLLDLNLTRKIAALTEADPETQLIEIGPGPGGLTRALLETGAQLTTVERDPRIAPILEQLSSAYPDRLVQVEADALRFDERSLGLSEDTVIASNLPYNISTELLVKWLTVQPRWWRRMVLMFQREVGDRILAAPNSKTYGRLSVLAQTMSVPSLGFHLPARAFTPPPKVDSSVLVFTPPESESTRTDALQRITAAAFGQRRKMVRSTLKPVFGERLSEVLTNCGIAETARAENLTPTDYVKLAEFT